ncbi:MAG: ATP-binding protein [Anaerolineae bacterium]|nr:ATP-binding protein [Anaerolineae bacterium]
MLAGQLYQRYITSHVHEALADTPVVLLNGPRQAGKTTLVKQWTQATPTAQTLPRAFRYLTLDDPATLLSAKQDPTGLVRSLDRAVIDEVQRAPELLLAIKRAVDEDRQPGRFLLTGSANLMTFPNVADSLAGRMEVLTLLPLAACEIQGGSGRWLDQIFAGNLPQPAQAVAKQTLGETLVTQVLRGGYPEALSRPTARRRAAWAKQYTDALIARDVREAANIEKLDQLSRLLRVLAQVAGQLCNFTQLGGQVGLDSKTAVKYLGVLEQLFLLRRVEQWSSNQLSRIVKTPKLQFIDSGLLSHLLGVRDAATISRQEFGHVLESYVFGELLKMASWSEGIYTITTYRDRDQHEVDFVVENERGKIIGIEVKASATVSLADFAGMKQLAAMAGDKFSAGLVLYDGVDTLPIGERYWAVPLASLWVG